MGGSYLYMIKDSIQFYIDVVTSPVVAFLLLSIFFLGVVYQLFSQRVNIIGILAVLSIFIFFSGHLLTGGGNMLTLILILLSGFLILIEFFVIGTLLGLIGIIVFGVSILTVSGNAVLYSIFLAVILVMVIIEWVIFVKHKKRKIPFLNRLILNDATDKESGYTSFDDRSHLVGEIAVTHTVLRPSGTIRLGDERIDAVAEGSYIPSDVKVKIIFVEGTRIVVRPTED
ncbi:serine protease [Jeotgalicoccus nanhaiensis]|jgi:Membrane-bound serine protease (ClpP class)|uniref:Serine protease n=1 Tax=Jeotgalicoccus nanhaiensis TaxID=568603 RepID=A0ABR9XW65_9STAP|nr:NfeD family protein [Jeotgalicoccus nanhaiensis]MBF0753265.1 serine protease [Jeotgalicoccus nanhaiensis]TFU62435.1 serine protease [Jeotgalicoccus nanhaiensis]